MTLEGLLEYLKIENIDKSSNGRDALEKIKTNKYDMLITDN
jgi:YesN/AraC family two-component response regulator